VALQVLPREHLEGTGVSLGRPVLDTLVPRPAASGPARYGPEGRPERLGERPAVAVGAISTGLASLDRALGIGGLPKGRIIELFGPESSGKSTLALHVVAAVQAVGGVCAYIDAEHALDPTYATKIGVKVDDLVFSQPDSAEQGLEIADLLARSGGVDVIVVDSVAALVPQAEVDGSMGDTHVGLQARLMSQALRKLTSTLAKTDTMAIFVNQLREKIGVMFGSPETTPGGRALKFYASVRLDVRRVETLKEDGKPVGAKVKVKVVKNKVAPPFGEAELEMRYGCGFDRNLSLLEAAAAEGVISRSGAWYAFGDQQIGQGRSGVAKTLGEHPDLVKLVELHWRSAAGCFKTA